MLLDVFDKNFTRIDKISNYGYVQYTKVLNGSGIFEIQIPLDETALNVYENGYFLMFEKDTVGIITVFNPAINGETNDEQLIIKGYLSNWLLARRYMPYVTNYTGTITEIIRQMVDDNCIHPTDSSRVLPLILSEDSRYIPTLYPATINTQITGDNLQGKIEELLDTREMGYDVHPVLTNTAMNGFEFRLIAGEDRTIGNTAGNPYVVFTTDLKNILKSQYTYNINDYCNMAYVAGEGENVDRIVEKAGNTTASGMDRYELYVDARDLQKEAPDEPPLTDDEYRAVLITRGLEKLGECGVEEVYEATIDIINTQYEYGVDYELGDLVTVKDSTIDLEMSARVTQIQVTSLGDRSLIDVTFGYYKLTQRQKNKRNGVM